MKYGRVMIAAPKSGSGKTVITCGLLSYLRDRSYNVRAYKCGPDYIDPMFHRQVIGVPGGNLDTFFSEPADIRRQIAESDCDSAVIEGVMGIYDGIAGASGQGSSYDVARVTGTPIVLVIDVKGMGPTMISVIKGIIADDTSCLIRGIVLNRISGRYLGEISPLIEAALEDISQKRGVSVRLLGGLPALKDIRLESRHLGLKMPDEIDDLEEQVTAARNLIAENVDITGLLEIMSQAENLSCEKEAGESSLCYGTEEPSPIPGESSLCYGTEEPSPIPPGTEEPSPIPPGTGEPSPVALAVARDEAFCFYYEENLRMLEKCGIDIIEFSPLYGRGLPEEADGILLGGGYPELYAEDLEDNVRMRESIREAVQNGMPCLAECGGFMYLMDEMADADGNMRKMCAVIDGTSRNTGRLGRFGYITISENTSDDHSGRDEKQETLLSGLCVKGHEFHYYDSDNNGDAAEAVKPGSGRSWECMHADERMLAGYPHLYYPSCPELIEKFRGKMEEYRQKRCLDAGREE